MRSWFKKWLPFIFILMGCALVSLLVIEWPFVVRLFSLWPTVLPIKGYENFFLLAGGAGATFSAIMLAVIALSSNLQLRLTNLDEDDEDIERMVQWYGIVYPAYFWIYTQSIGSYFLCVMIVSLVMSIPSVTGYYLGSATLVLTTLILCAVIFTLRLLSRAKAQLLEWKPGPHLIASEIDEVKENLEKGMTEEHRSKNENRLDRLGKRLRHFSIFVDTVHERENLLYITAKSAIIATAGLLASLLIITLNPLVWLIAVLQVVWLISGFSLMILVGFLLTCLLQFRPPNPKG